jgi:hypothetical protein
MVTTQIIDIMKLFPEAVTDVSKVKWREVIGVRRDFLLNKREEQSNPISRLRPRLHPSSSFNVKYLASDRECTTTSMLYQRPRIPYIHWMVHLR